MSTFTGASATESLQATALLGTLALRCEPRQARSDERVDRAVGRLPYLAAALPEIDEQLLLGHHALALEHQPHQVLAGHGADEEIPFPFGEEVPRIEHHPGRGDRRHPVVDRLLDTRCRGSAVADAHILAAVGLTRVVL